MSRGGAATPEGTPVSAARPGGPLRRGRTLTVSGSAYEQGRQQGAMVGDLIRENLAQVLRLVREVNAKVGGRYAQFLAANTEYLRGAAPELIDECEGLAAGAGLPLTDVLALNLPLYVALRRSQLSEECSIFAVSRTRACDGVTHLVKSRDQPHDQFQFEHVVLRREYPDGSRIVEVNAAGIVTNPGSGLNSHGLALGTAGVWSMQRLPVDAASIGGARAMPDTHTLLRLARSVDDVVALLRDTSASPRLSGINYLAADATGRVAAIECTAQVAHVTEADEGVACLTNHYVHPELAGLGPGEAENPVSYRRRARILDALGHDRDDLGLRSLLRIAVDHGEDGRDAVCRHASGIQGSNTRYASFACVEANEMWTLIGHPCEVAVVAAP